MQKDNDEDYYFAGWLADESALILPSAFSGNL